MRAAGSKIPAEWGELPWGPGTVWMAAVEWMAADESAGGATADCTLPPPAISPTSPAPITEGASLCWCSLNRLETAPWRRRGGGGSGGRQQLSFLQGPPRRTSCMLAGCRSGCCQAHSLSQQRIHPLPKRMSGGLPSPCHCSQAPVYLLPATAKPAGQIWGIRRAVANAWGLQLNSWSPS